MATRPPRARTLTFFDARPPLPAAPLVIEVEGIAWTRRTWETGGVSYQAKCPTSGAALTSDTALAKPFAMRCVCGKWHRLP
ncbi:MAG TPA: hypothetical protein VFE26_10845 [Trebonia sp.]|jgi:hypothetical protein|nr:hypothetical protein [Trebonia sp.]